MILNSAFFTITCYLILRLVGCFNLTQSVFKLMINDIDLGISSSADFGSPPFTWTRTRRHGKYREKSYIVKTDDGYLLTYYRIVPSKNQYKGTKRNPVLLHHGLLGTWVDWKIQGTEKSLAYQLAGHGFDVWMGNSRGSTYAKKHETLKSSQKEFWNFTFHEMGMRDISKGIDYILNATKQKQLIYIGYSQGNTILYVLLSSKPEYNEKILFHIGAGAVAAMPRTKSLFTTLVPFASLIGKTTDTFTNGASLEHYLVLEMILRWTCEAFTSLCRQIIFSAFGESPKQFNKDLLFQDVLKHNPSGTSTKNMLHWAQLIYPGIFSPYRSRVKYNISKITAPVKLFYGSSDILSNKQDLDDFYDQLPNPLGCEAVGHEQWNHIDFVYGINIDSLWIEKVVQFAVDATNRQGFIKTQIDKSLQERDAMAPIKKVYKRDYIVESPKVPRIPLRVMGRAIREVQEIINKNTRTIKMILRETTEHVHQILQKSAPLINDTIHAVQEPEDLLKELEDFYKEIDSYVNKGDSNLTR